MTIEEFDTALAALNWRPADFCRMTGLHRNTPSRWRTEGVPIPAWVPKHLALLQEVQRLHTAYLAPQSSKVGGDLPMPGGEMVRIEKTAGTTDAEVNRMKDALEWIIENGPDDAWDLRQRAREALGDKS